MTTCCGIKATGSYCTFKGKYTIDGMLYCGFHVPKGEMCPVCLSGMNPEYSSTTHCGHQFHTKCINRWKSCGGIDCPVCRASLLPAPVRDWNYLLQTLFQRMQNLLRVHR
jgi:hypothetical protein